MPIPTLTPRSHTATAPWRSARSLPSRTGSVSRKRRIIVRYVLPIGGALILLGILSTVALFAYYSRDLPDPNGIIDRTVAQSTKIYARDGSTLLYEIHGEERRTVVDLEVIPDHLKWATIDTEDKDFYKHGGIDLRGMLRGAFRTVFSLGSKEQGGSTITQQFIKNSILTNEKTITRKIKEAVLAYQIERRFTKDQILKLYFNEIPYGRNAYGAEAASRVFFGKPVQDISLDEAALLAALPQAPTYYSPDGNHRDALVGRQHYVLDRMVDQGHLTQAEAEAAKQIDTLNKVIPKREAIVAPHFVIYVREQITEKYGEKLVEQGGLKVTTTLEPNLQSLAESAVSNGMAKIEKYGGSNAALVALNPNTGQILALVGSRDYFDTEHDGNVNVALRPRQPGSSFKPIVYAQAFKAGYTPETILYDLRTNFGGSPAYVPSNYDGQEHGQVTMRQALAGSLNISAVKTLYLAGIDKVLELAHAMGYTTLNEPDRYGLSLTLGGGEVKLLDHVAAFSVFANDGRRVPVVSVLKIEDRSGKVLEEAKEIEGERVLDENVSRLITSILSDNGARSFIFGSRNWLTLDDRPVAAKTGTTNDFRDAWTVGFTPNFAAGVWAGNNDNSEMGRGADGSVIAAPIWNDFMRRAVSGAKVVGFKAPRPNNADKPVLQGKLGGQTIKVDSITGQEIPASCLDVYPKEFIKDQLIEEIHSILHYVDKANPRGPVPDRPEKDPQYQRWEEPVRAWAAQAGRVAQRPPAEDCGLRDPKHNPKVSLNEPTNGTVVTGTTMSVAATVQAEAAATVSVQLDYQEVASLKSAPYATTLDISGLSAGRHSLKLIATDALGRVGSIEIEFSRSNDPTSATLYFTNPSPGQTIDLSAGAVKLSVFASDPDGVSEVRLVITNASNQQATLSAVASSDNKYSADWLPAAAGDYRLTAILIDQTGGQTTSDALAVTIVAD